MKNKKSKYDYSSVFRCFKLYEYIYKCAKQELDRDNSSALVSDRTERLVIDYPDKFIKKYFPDYSYNDEEFMREMLYGVLRSKRLSILIWTDDNRTCRGAGKDTIHIIKPDCISERTVSERIESDIKLLLENVEKTELLEKQKKLLKKGLKHER